MRTAREREADVVKVPSPDVFCPLATLQTRLPRVQLQTRIKNTCEKHRGSVCTSLHTLRPNLS